MRKANCIICGNEFDKTHNKKTCGPECAQKNSLKYQNAYSLRRRRPPDPIDPFPDGIDRDAFGHWLSGFADGEATFGLRVIENRGRGRFVCSGTFRITLRDDDAGTLELIRSFWGCGKLYFADNARSKTTNAKPVAIYSVQSIPEIFRVLIPHFEKFPLRAKKRHDFALWRQGIELAADVQSRPAKWRPGRAANRHGGIFPKWSEADRERFSSLAEQLRNQRIYAPADLTPARNSCAATP